MRRRWMQRRAAACLALGLAAAVTAPARAQESVFSLQFLGISEESGDVRARSMGQLGVAFADPRTAATLNPAGLAALERMTLSVTGLAGVRTAREGSQEDSRGLARFPHQRVALPVPGRVVLSLGFVGLRNFRSEFALPERGLVGLAYDRSFERSGSFFVVPLGVARAFGSHVQLGLTLDSFLGTVDESWTTGGDSLLSLRTRRRDSYRATTVTAGVLVTPVRGVHLGLAATPAFDADRSSRTTIEDARLVTSSTGLRDATVKSEAHVPATLRFGAAVDVGKMWRLGADALRRDWADYEGRLYGAEAVGLETRVGGGVEFRPGRTPWWGRLSYRAGLSRTTWPQRVAGDRLRETTMHGGFGFDLRGGYGRLDAGFEYGRLGSLERNGREEKCWRFLLGLSGQEIWRRKSPRK